MPKRLSDEERQAFDAILAEVVEDLPAEARAMLDEVPLIVEDRARKSDIAHLENPDPDEVLGLHTGVPLPDHFEFGGPHLPEQVYLFRIPHLIACTDDDGEVDVDELAYQMRITILHELGHHVGMDEDDLDEIGYG